MHDAATNKPHAILTSDKHSNGFINCLKALKFVNISQIFAYHLARKIRVEIGDQKIDWVIASPMAGITFGHDVARFLEASIFMFTEKDPADKDRMLWKREIIPANANVLQIEELITTAKTTNMVQDAINESNGNEFNWIPVVGTLVLRPDKLPMTHVKGRKVIPLLEKEIWSVVENECRLCVTGSEALKAKTVENWAKLTE